MFGCVVVGVGIAGKVRIRDLLTPLASSAAEIFTLKGLVSRRMLDEVQGVRQMPLEEALTRSDVQVAFICTENTSHEDYISPFLEAGKHVSVEYPMVLSYNAVADLMAQAQRKGLILHEEHIELLTPAFKQLKKDVAGKQLEEGSLHFTGGPLKSGSGFLAFSGMSRLTWLVDLFGELSVKAATMDEQPEKKHSKMTVQLLTKDQKSLSFVYTCSAQTPDLDRGTCRRLEPRQTHPPALQHLHHDRVSGRRPGARGIVHAGHGAVREQAAGLRATRTTPSREESNPSLLRAG
ncbi:biliverdin reductase A isoform X2 [Tachysurus fulvidraco]|uniref:biliverdin reductase A isoform X2 n=1 Tax=Tachysurus fulvidraco TaxID=1234273 RepID=UPI001FEFFA74|nr:biliverdin reductase A isoform X2 [Tachysurus fulvidraco]